MNVLFGPKNSADRRSKFQNTTLASFFDQVYQAFEHASQASGEQIDRTYQIGGYHARLCFAGTAFAPKITPAFEHLLIEREPTPSLTVYLWDSASTAVELPDFLGNEKDYLESGDAWMGASERFNFFFRPSTGTLSFLDMSRGEAIYWTRSAAQFPYYESGAPLRMILNWWMGSRGTQLVHAGAVGTNEGGVLLVGKGGSGKSTTALACLVSNLFYVGDDYCMVSESSPPYVHSLYCSGKLNAEDVGRFPDLTSALNNGDSLDTEKALYFFYRHFPHQISRRLPVQAILIPEITDSQETRLRKVSPAASFLALAPSTIFQLRDGRQPIHKSISDLVRKAPSYKLELGTEISRIPDVIKELVSELSES